MERLEFRIAKKSDTTTILSLIKEFAEYEKRANEVVATEEILNEWIFDKKTAIVVLGELRGEVVGYCLYFYNFSSFLGRAGIYLEDLYVKSEYRGQGFGNAFLTNLAKIAVNEKLGRIDWSCLDWNKNSIDFYLSKNAVQMNDWTSFRIDAVALQELANEKVR